MRQVNRSFNRWANIVIDAFQSLTRAVRVSAAAWGPEIDLSLRQESDRLPGGFRSEFIRPDRLIHKII